MAGWFDQFQPRMSADQMIAATSGPNSRRTFDGGALPSGDMVQGDPEAFIRQWQATHPATNESFQQMVATAQQQGIPMVIATHAGGTQASGDKVVLPNGQVVDAKTDTGWNYGADPYDIFGGDRQVVLPNGQIGNYGEYLQSKGLPMPNVPTPPPGYGQSGFGAGGLPPGYQFNSDPNGIWAAGGPGLAQPWMRQFQAPDTVGNFNDPGYDARLKEAQKAIERSASSKGTLLTGGTLKDLAAFSQDYASNEYDKVYGRRLGEYQMDRDSFFNNQRSLFGNLFNLSSLGQSAASQTGNYGTNYANQAGEDYTGLGDAQGRAAIGRGNAWATPFSNAGNIAQQAYYANLFNQPSA